MWQPFQDGVERGVRQQGNCRPRSNGREAEVNVPGGGPERIELAAEQAFQGWEQQVEVTGSRDQLKILYLGVNPWQGIKQRPQHLAEGLAIRNRVIYLNPVPPGIPHSIHASPKSPFDERTLLKSGIERRLFVTTKLNERLIAIDVHGLPGSYISTRLHSVQLNVLFHLLLKGLSRDDSYPDVLWLSHPRQVSAARQISSKTVLCYDCMDDYPRMVRASHRRRSVRNEEEVLSRADIVFATSKTLEEKCKLLARRVVRVPNGVDFERFASSDGGTFGERRPTSAPVLGYFGWIDLWTDIELVSQIAAARPTWVIRMIGPRNNPHCEELRRVANVEFIDEVPYDRLPDYAQKFDVCIMPFVIDDMTQSINPVKMYEYLATGKPVVSTDLPEVRNLTPLVRVARDSRDFISEVEHALKEKDPSLGARRREVAQLNTWDRRVQLIETEIRKSLGSPEC